MEEPSFDAGRIIQELIPEKSSAEANFEEIDLAQLDQLWKDTNIGNFYKNLSQQEVQGVVPAYFRSFREASTYIDFKENLKNLGLNDQQKIIFLQSLGNDLGRIYNYDMLERDEYVKISEEDMFQALKGVREGGICGNIHTFMLTVAQELGIRDVWLQDGIVEFRPGVTNGHVWMGMIAKGAGGIDEIVYMDYDTVVPTGTLDPVKARGVMERYHRQISMFNSYVGGKDNVLLPVESFARRTLGRAAGISGSGAMLSENLESGAIRRDGGLELTLSNEITELKVSNGLVGMAFVHYEGQDNPYQAINDLSGLRASLRLGNNNVGAEFDTTVLHLNIKDLYNGIFSQN